MTDIPLPMRWDGCGFLPLNQHWAKQADKAYVVGQVYRVVTVEDRSAKSHRFYFAAINEAFENLPEALAPQFGSPEHLRRFALVQSGFADERSIVCASKAEALRVAAFIRPIDEFSVVVVRDATVKVFTPQSQSVRAMGKAEFERSKNAVLDVIAKLIGVAPETLAHEAHASPPTAPSSHARQKERA